MSITVKIKIIDKKHGIHIQLSDSYNNANAVEIEYADAFGKVAYDLMRGFESKGAEVLHDNYHGLRSDDVGIKGEENDGNKKQK